ncbi:hypothetical protein Poly59_31160 [Rubripirellula reticaptiva]|uniref:Uncharacterized protein n=1 Tax=Rubripirellula reticaptiva TaxID=2528013 RepID=A0A5C6EAQ7_9BACT|nr:hypothetical protein Poly59_61290 [Rubripirellula reticaptiva]TWU51524.1 hypothetical protein Poly59_31160 [Rubripirellula reticaptiva]
MLQGVIGVFGAIVVAALAFASPPSLLTISLLTTTIVFRGFCGLAGGILLWQGRRKGYQFSVGCWMYLTLVGLLALVQLFFVDLSAPYMMRHVGSTIGKLLFGSAFTYVLLADLLNSSSLAFRKPQQM